MAFFQRMGYNTCVNWICRRDVPFEAPQVVENQVMQFRAGVWSFCVVSGVACSALVISNCAAAADYDPAESGSQTPVTQTPVTQTREQIRQATARAKRKQRMTAVFSRKLTRMAPIMGPTTSAEREKRAPDDFFLLGTAQLDAVSKNADLCFQVKQGQTEVADFIADYILDEPDRAVRKWHVFARFKDNQTAEEGLVHLQQRYDLANEYQAQIARIYAARATRRT